MSNSALRGTSAFTPSATTARFSFPPLSGPSEELYNDYRNELNELTINSGPKIHSLTSIAKENIAHAKAIVQAIVERISTAPLGEKLPSFYLLDSICKVIGGVYINILKPLIHKLFMDYWVAATPEIRQKVERVLSLWYKGGAGGSPVFPIHILDGLKAAVAEAKVDDLGSSLHNSQVSSSSSSNSFMKSPAGSVVGSEPRHRRSSRSGAMSNKTPTTATVSNGSDGVKELLDDMCKLIGKMQVKRLKSPSNAAIPATIKQVEKLKEELRDSVSDQRRYEIWKEVYDTAESYSIKLSRPEPPQPRPQPQSAAAVSQASSILDQLLAMATSAGTPVAAQTITQIPTQAPSGTAPVTAAPQQPAVDIMALFDSLQSIGTFNNTNNTASNMMGGVQVSSTATAAPVPAPNAYGVYPATTASSAVTTAATIATATPPPPVVLSGGISGAPAIPIISSQPGGLVPPISLSRSDIKKKRPGLYRALYDEGYPLNCRQCGWRCKNATEQDKTKMQEHLDWHFRRNRRAKERLQKIRPRGWFVSLEAWEGAKEIEDVEMSEAALFGLEGSADSKKKSYNPYDDDDETEDIDKQLGLDEYSNGRVAAGNGDDLNSGGGGGEADGGEGSTGGDSRQAIRNKNIVVVNPDFQSKKCPICREKFDMFWSDEDEEWMCRNARFLNNELHHATCYIDMMKKKQAIEAAAAANVNTSVELKVKTAMKRKSSSGLNPADNTNGNGNHESKNQSQSSNLVATNPDEPNPKRQALESTS